MTCLLPLIASTFVVISLLGGTCCPRLQGKGFQYFSHNPWYLPKKLYGDTFNRTANLYTFPRELKNNVNSLCDIVEVTKLRRVQSTGHAVHLRT
jgi:hypothetical protein